MLALFAVLACAAAAPAARPQRPAAPPPVDLEAWRAHLAPAADEQRWRAIPWRPSLASGLEAAAQARRPLLLWLMNGHPLGCT